MKLVLMEENKGIYEVEESSKTLVLTVEEEKEGMYKVVGENILAAVDARYERFASNYTIRGKGARIHKEMLSKLTHTFIQASAERDRLERKEKAKRFSKQPHDVVHTNMYEVTYLASSDIIEKKLMTGKKLTQYLSYEYVLGFDLHEVKNTNIYVLNLFIGCGDHMLYRIRKDPRVFVTRNSIKITGLALKEMLAEGHNEDVILYHHTLESFLKEVEKVMEGENNPAFSAIGVIDMGKRILDELNRAQNSSEHPTIEVPANVLPFASKVRDVEEAKLHSSHPTMFKIVKEIELDDAKFAFFNEIRPEVLHFKRVKGEA